MSVSKFHMNPRTYLFIDGGYFREQCRNIATQIFNVDDVPLAWYRLATNFRKIFYYDCPIPRRDGEVDTDYQKRRQDQVRWLNALRRQDGFHVFEGVIVGVGGKARQKQVDVRITVDMLMHAHRKNMTHATLVAGDLDFKPVLDSLVELGIDVTLWCHQSSASIELIGAADHLRRLNAQTLHEYADTEFQSIHLLPTIVSRSGRNTEGLTLSSKGTGPDGEEVEVYVGERKAILVHRDILNLGHFIHVEHENLDYAIRVFENVFFPVNWQKEKTNQPM